MPELQELYLDYNEISVAGLGALVSALRDGGAPKLTVLAVGGNPAGAAGERSAKQLLNERRRVDDRRGGDSRREDEAATDRCSRN
eukprot:434557-Prymnesium_polylepis.1